MNDVHAEDKTVRELLSGSGYTVDFYQREFRWQKKQIEELVRDLSQRFLDDYRSGHRREQVEEYGQYYLGPIIISHKDNRDFLIDGQQRLTSLTLLLIYLDNLQRGSATAVNIKDMIFSERFARKRFNVDIEERVQCMEALYQNGEFDDTGAPESVQNMVERYEDIDSCLPEEIRGDALPYFVDWLTDRVVLVKITALSDDDAYTIFETMNDRGLSLSLVDMLKGHLLVNIDASDKRSRANDFWRERIGELRSLGKDEDADFFKDWLRSQYARGIRERRAGAEPEDFDHIATSFHRWVSDSRDLIGLTNGQDYFDFVDKNFRFFSRQYLDLLRASREPVAGSEVVYYNAQLGFTLQYMLLLAPLCPTDNPESVSKKLRIVARFVDILLARRIWNNSSITHSALKYTAFATAKQIRGKDPAELAATLRTELDAPGFAGNPTFRLHSRNRWFMHRILARMTDYVEREAGLPSQYREYVTARGRGGYEIEHVWANHPEQHLEEFPVAADFVEYRNRIGGLLLLPKSFNASYGDLTYEAKLPHYLEQNLLARSLHPQCYNHNPGFLEFVQRSGTAFTPHEHFRKSDLDTRQSLYISVAEKLWNPDLLDWELAR